MTLHEASQSIIFHQPGFSWNKGISLPKGYLLEISVVWGRYNLTRMRVYRRWKWLFHQGRCGMCLAKKSKKTSPRKISQQFCPPKKWEKQFSKGKATPLPTHLFSGAKIVEFRGWKAAVWQEKESKSPILFHNPKTMDESQIAMPTAPQKNPAPKLVNLVIPQLRKGTIGCTPDSVPMVSLWNNPIYTHFF